MPFDLNKTPEFGGLLATKPPEHVTEADRQSAATAALSWRFIGPMAESPVKKDVIWRSSDDGLIELTRDEGKTMSLNYYDETDFSFNSGLNRFVWDMRYPGVTAIPERPVTDIRPKAKPGKHFAKLIVGKHAQVQAFELRIDPNGTFTKEQTDAKFVFWMELYENVEKSTQDVLKALKRKKDTLKKFEEFKASGVDADKLAAAEQQAAVIADMVDTYESNFVPVAPTPAESINQLAKIFTKMLSLHNMMEASEGPPTQSMLDAYEN